jgi:type IV pilus assembly protein PilO
MTLSGNLEPMEPAAPKLFGISFTPPILGGLLALLGIGLAGYLSTLLVMPKLDEINQLSSSIEEKKNTLAQQKQLVQQVEEIKQRLAKAQAQNKEVRGLFSTQAALDTLLLDLNRVISQSGAALLKFEPDYAASGIVTDGSIGPELNGKIRRQVTTVSFQGSFSETLTVLQRIDQLQTLLVIQGYTTEVKDDTAEKIIVDPLTSNFKLIAYIPLTEEELLANPAPATPGASPAQPPQ